MKRKNYFKRFCILAGIFVITAAFLVADSNLKASNEVKSSVKVEKQIKDDSIFPFNTDSGVFSVQADSKIQSMSSSKDTYSDTQWYIHNPGYFINYEYGYRVKNLSVAGVDMNVKKAWNSMADLKQAKRQVVIAIIDSGVDYLHKDLSDHIWRNQGEIPGDHIDNDNNGYVDDVYGWDFYNNDASICHYDQKGKKKTADSRDNDNHGTHLAGVIAAAADNDTGIAGIASDIDIKIMVLKIYGGKNSYGRISDAIAAIRYATRMGADICNLSWGTTQYSKGLYEAMKESDMLFIAAAGNSGTNNDQRPLYPATYNLDNLITVTAIDSNGALAYYSNYGKRTVDIAAPGDDIYSTVVGGYAIMSGSSMAAPQVTAVAAMLYSCSNHIYAANAKNILVNNLKLMPKLKNLVKYPGIPDAYKVVMSAGKLQQDYKAPVLSLHTIYHKNKMIVPVEAKDTGNSQVRVIKWSYGKKKAADFDRGVSGNPVINNEVSLKNEGNYTFYASDYAGNETAVIYKVSADKTAPVLKVSYSVSDNYKQRTVTVKANDTQSGVKQIKYMSGIRKSYDFLLDGKGTEVDQKDGKGVFQVKKDGTYTVFVSDNRGNVTIRAVKVKTVKTTELNYMETRRTILVGDILYLEINSKPVGSTDKIIYMSSDEQVATVTYSGKVIALKKGTAKISARASSGVTATCIITVNSDA